MRTFSELDKDVARRLLSNHGEKHVFEVLSDCFSMKRLAVFLQGKDSAYILYAKDGGDYMLVINGGARRVLTIGGAYSVDKQHRLSNGWRWFENEQLSEEERADIEDKLMPYYDIVLTGDLGSLGNELLLMILKEEHGISASNIVDAGASLYKKDQNKLSGASGPVVLPLYLFNKVLLSKRNKKILIVGTGALHNPTLVNQKKSIPAIAHAVELEVSYDN